MNRALRLPQARWLASLLCLALVGCPGDSVTPSREKNILLVVLDDVGVDRVAAYGLHPDAGPTPVIDALARQGVLFRRAYADPVCSPTRTTILSGRYASRTGIGTTILWGDSSSRIRQHVPDGETFIPALLPDDYRSAAIGKWHLSTLATGGYDAAIDHGFDEFRGAIAGLRGSYYSFPKTVADASGFANVVETRYATTVEVDDALDRIEAFGAQPWFVWLALHAPHSPWQPPPKKLHSFGDLRGSPAAVRYRAVLEAADGELGRLLSSMPPETLERTTVIIVGDNGTPGAAKTPPSRAENAKGKLYDGGTRVPLIISGAGVRSPGRVVEHPVNTVDLFPTVLGLAGAVPPETDGVSLIRYLKEPTAGPARRWVYTRRHGPNGFGPYAKYRRAAFDGRYKLILRGPDNPAVQLPPVEFLDLLADPDEKTNLAPDGTTEGLNDDELAAFRALEGVLASLDSVAAPSDSGPAEDLTLGEIEQLRTLGYAAWDENADESLRSVTVFDRGRASPGYDLYTNDVDEVYLQDLEGERVHTWRIPGKKFCEHAELLSDGSLAVVCTHESLVRLDWDSNVIWERPIAIHHDVASTRDGSFLVPFIESRNLHHGRIVKFDGIAEISPAGRSRPIWSSHARLEELQRYHPASALDSAAPLPPANKPQRRLDYYHLNSVEVLPDSALGRRDPRFRTGNLLICLRNVNLVLILDRDDLSVVWHWGTETLDAPHMPTLLENGNILIFDNGYDRGFSRVIELDPTTMDEVWSYEGEPRSEFFSDRRGSAQRLPNGNTLIAESQSGHVFEVTGDGTKVWEFWNPEIVDGKRKRIYRFIRLSRDFVEPLLDAGAARQGTP
jgi:arylsulfatase A-like enzyme